MIIIYSLNRSAKLVSGNDMAFDRDRMHCILSFDMGTKWKIRKALSGAARGQICPRVGTN